MDGTQNGTKNLRFGNFARWVHIPQERRADKISILISGDLGIASVDQNLRALIQPLSE